MKHDTLAIIDNHNFYDRHTYIRTWRLYDHPGPEGKVGEKIIQNIAINKENCNCVAKKDYAQFIY